MAGAYQNLAAAILTQADKDYKKHPAMRSEITRFIRSPWGINLLNHFNYFDQELFIKKIKERAKELELIS